MPKKTAAQAQKSPLTAAWKKAFEAGWVNRFAKKESILHNIEQQEEDEDFSVESEKLSKHRVGPYLIIPRMCDDNEVSADLLSVVGFKHVKTVEVVMGNPTCKTYVYEEDPTHTGKRGVLLQIQNQHVHWLLMLT